MNFKKITIFSLIIFSLILCIGIVSAAENTSSIDDIQVADINNQSQDVQTQEVVKTKETKPKVTKKIKTDVDADQVSVVYKKNNYFKVKVEDDKKDKPVSKINIKLKIYTGSKSKTYTVKTNSKGIAKFNTKNLKLGSHKVVITSGDDKYTIKKSSKIFVGKLHKKVMKVNTVKTLKNKDKIKVYVKHKSDEKEVKVKFKGKTKYTKILKVKFYFKNKYTGKIKTKIDYAEFEDGKWEWPDEDCSYKYVPIKVKVWYVTSK